MGTWEHLANFLGNKGDQRTSFGGIGEHSAFIFVGSIQKASLGTREIFSDFSGNTGTQIPLGGLNFAKMLDTPIK